MFRFDRVLYIRVLPETAETMPPPIAQLLSGKAARAAAVNKANAAKGLRLKDTEMAVRQYLKDLVRRVDHNGACGVVCQSHLKMVSFRSFLFMSPATEGTIGQSSRVHEHRTETSIVE